MEGGSLRRSERSHDSRSQFHQRHCPGSLDPFPDISRGRHPAHLQRRHLAQGTTAVGTAESRRQVWQALERPVQALEVVQPARVVAQALTREVAGGQEAVAPPGLVLEDNSRSPRQGQDEHRAEGAQALDHLVARADGGRHIGPERAAGAGRGRLVHRSFDTHKDDRTLGGAGSGRSELQSTYKKSKCKSTSISKKVLVQDACREKRDEGLWVSTSCTRETHANSSDGVLVKRFTCRRNVKSTTKRRSTRPSRSVPPKKHERFF